MGRKGLSHARTADGERLLVVGEESLEDPFRRCEEPSPELNDAGVRRHPVGVVVTNGWPPWLYVVVVLNAFTVPHV